MKDRNTVYKIIFALSIGFTLVVLFTGGIARGAGSIVLTLFVLLLIFIVNAGYGGGFSNVPTLLSDHYGMGNISAIHGITLSAWAFAGLSGNQLASFIVNHTGQFVDVAGVKANPAGYQNVADCDYDFVCRCNVPVPLFGASNEVGEKLSSLR